MYIYTLVYIYIAMQLSALSISRTFSASQTETAPIKYQLPIPHLYFSPW